MRTSSLPELLYYSYTAQFYVFSWACLLHSRPFVLAFADFVRRRKMPTSKLSLSTDDGRITGIEIDLESATLDDLQTLVEVEFGIMIADQMLVCEGRYLCGGPGQSNENSNKKLKELSVLPDALLLVARRIGGGGGSAAAGTGAGGAAARAGAGAVRPPPPGGFRIGGLGPALKRVKTSAAAVPDPATWSSLSWDDVSLTLGGETIWKILQVNEAMTREIEHTDPELYAAAKHPTPDKMKAFVLTRALSGSIKQVNKSVQRIQAEKRLAENPFDVEAQKILEEQIAEENVARNWENAMEHMPEAFGNVFMLYINAAINGTPVKVFVDSGAQSTILSKECAERCNIMRLVDTRYAGTAVGVGTSKIIGRVHMAPLRVGDHNFPCSFTVLEDNKVDCLFGLDMLKRYQCCIDLGKNSLRLSVNGSEVSVPFLGEAEIPENALGSTKRRSSGAATSTSAAAGAKPASSSSSSSSGSSSAMAIDEHPAPLPPASHAHAAAGSSSSSASFTSAASIPGAGAGVMAGASTTITTGSSSSSTAPVAPPLPAATAPGAVPASSPSNLNAIRFDFSAIGRNSSAAPASRSAAAPSVPAPAAGTAATAAAAGPSEASIAILTSMGFPRAKCIQALVLANGNVEAAAALLPDLM